MADYHEYVDGIRPILQSGQLPDDATLRELAEGYARACARANERLTGCVRLLHQGLRAEAIHQAETEPNLLDTLTSLDFPERAEWDELSDDKGLVRSQALNLEAARELNEAYAQQDPLRDLLRRHRRMALAQSPLPRRLALLRTIANEDPNTPIWRDDVQRYEQARLLQVQAEADRALTVMDPTGLQNLLTELEDTRWTTPPPARLIRRVHDELAELRRVQGRRLLAAIAEDLLKAFESHDLETARGLRDRWDDQAPLAGMGDHDPLLDQVRPALAWVEEESQRQAADHAYERAVADLRAALERGEIDAETLAELGEAVAVCGRGTPRELAAQLVPRLKELRRRRLRRTLAVGSTVFALLIAALLLLYQAITVQTLARQSLRAAGLLTDLLNGENLEGAEKYVKQLSLGIKNSSAMKAPLGRLEAAQQVRREEESRLARWLSDVRNMPADLPDLPPLKDRTGTIPVPPSFRSEYEKTVGDYRARYDRQKDKSEREFLSQVDEVQKSLGALEALIRDSIRLPDVDRKADEVQRDLDPLLRNNDVKIMPVRPRAQVLMERLAHARKLRADWLRRDELQQKLTTSSVMAGFDDAPFTGVLQDYTREFPEDENGKDYKRVLDAALIWRGALAWSRMLEKWRADKLLELDSAAANTRAEECRRILTDYPQLPDRSLAEQYQKYLEAVARREGKGSRLKGKAGGVRAELEEVWRDPLATQLYVITLKDGKRYYFRDPVTRKGGAINVKCIIDVDPDNPKHLKQKVFAETTIESQELAPQCEISLRVVSPQFLEKGWEAANLDILRDLCDRKKKYDPIYRLYLLKTTAELAAEGSLALETALEPLIQAIDRAAIDTRFKWMNPEDEKVNREQRNASAVLDQLPSPGTVDEVVKTFHRQLRAKLARVLTPVGRLVRDRTAWKLGAGRPVPPGTKLWIASPVDGGPAVWQDIGTASARETTLNGGSAGARAWIEGLPVFAELGPTAPIP